MKILKINIFITALLFLQSCLNLDPEQQLADSNIWETPAQFELFANQFYGWVKDFNSLSDGPHSDHRSDLVTFESADIYSNGTNAVPPTEKSYTDTYNRLRQVNILLEKSESYSLPEDIKVSVGEAHFFRAYLHFDLVQTYGDIAIANDIFTTSSPELSNPRSPRGEVIDFVIKDLRDAISKLPAHKEISASNAGRVSREAAQAFLSRVTLYEGTWQKFRGNKERGKELLKIAYEAADEVIKSGTFSIFKPKDLGTNAYKYLFTLENTKSNPASIGKNGNTEYIFVRRHDEIINPAGSITHGYFANVLYITRKFANMFLNATTGLPIDPTTWNYSKMDSEFNNRDNRMTNIMLVAGRPYWDNENGRITWKEDATDIAIASKKSFEPMYGSGYHNQKWCTERKVADGSEGYDFPVIRYAEVLLNYAEALFEYNSEAGNIDDKDLDKSLNLVRLRVNPDMPKLSNALVAANNLDMRTEIRRERTIELFMESFRVDDLKRWKTAETEMPMPLRGIKWTGTEYATTWAGNTKQKDSEGCIILESGRIWKDKNYLYPLPADQLKLNPNLKQNPGWE
ncbi:MAG TPA: RagB/SusD family nutrient uptake outer membrane protein [Candidatus Bacteroides intestinigallinarum]|nr:RagB/SusD family nutrient uptake outer membrane protein [Candidatus Bacteroides intestinigallinarum]